MRSKATPAKLISLYNPHSPISESFRTLRTNIQFTGVSRELRSLMVTSAGKGEGKSTIVSNLAVTMAQAGKSVLIIDADLRNPQLHRMFNVSNLVGLSDVLIKKSLVEEAVKVVPDPCLELIPAGSIPPNPADLLGSPQMKEVLVKMVPHYDMVLIDTPPVIAVTDPQLLANAVDGVLLVLGSGNVLREDAKKAKTLLDQVSARVIGTVLNKKPVDAVAYY